MPSHTSSADDYLIPSACSIVEYTVKKSRFIAWACPATDRTEALQWLSEAQKAYPDARHHCWAYQIGSPNNPTTAAMSDDGEPSGTAGKPIFNVLQHKNVGDIVVIVIRYFGGVKLGAGGLVRAYSHATQMAMAELETTTKVALTQFSATLDFDKESKLRYWLSENQGQLDNVKYTAIIHADCYLPSKSIDAWAHFCAQEDITFSKSD